MWSIQSYYFVVSASSVLFSEERFLKLLIYLASTQIRLLYL